MKEKSIYINNNREEGIPNKKGYSSTENLLFYCSTKRCSNCHTLNFKLTVFCRVCGWRFVDSYG